MQKKLKFFLPSHKKLDGFTAIELLVTIAIAAILAALAGPSFKTLLDRWRVHDAQESMQSTLYLLDQKPLNVADTLQFRNCPKPPLGALWRTLMKNGAAAGLFSPTKTTMGNGKQPKNVYKSLQPQKIPTSFTKAAAKALELIDME